MGRTVNVPVASAPREGAGGYALLADSLSTVARGRPRPFRFKVLDPEGLTVRGFDARDGARMHLVVARRRDLAHYRHLQPAMSLDGTWWAPLELPEPGRYRAIADFSVGGEGQTLGVDLLAPGSVEARPVPAPARVATADGYEVALEDADLLAAGRPVRLAFRVALDGRAVSGFEPLGGVRARLEALRAGDLAFLRGRTVPGRVPGELLFEAAFPGEGRYRLYVSFVHDGRERTAGFTVEVVRAVR